MRTLALYSVLFVCIAASLVFFASLGGPAFVEQQYDRNRPHRPKPKGPPISHSQSHAWQTQREWTYEYPRDARNYGLDEAQCLSAFPDLYKEVDRAVAWWKEKGGITERELDVGWRGDAIEAECFAYLAVRALRTLPLSFPMTTGVRVPITGGLIAKPS